MFRWISKRLQELESHITLFQFFRRYLFPVIGAVMSALAAALTDVLQEFAPASWIFAGLFGGVLTAAILSLVALFHERLRRARYYLLAEKTELTVNPLENVFERQRLKVSDFTPPTGNRLTNKIFRECDLVGPGNIVLGEGVNVNGMGLFECDVVAIDGNIPAAWTALVLEQCVLTDVRIHRCCLLVPRPFVPVLQNGFKGYQVPWLNQSYMNEQKKD